MLRAVAFGFWLNANPLNTAVSPEQRTKTGRPEPERLGK